MKRMKQHKEIDKTSLIIRIVGGILILMIAAMCILLIFRRIGKSRMTSVIADSGHMDIGEAPENPVSTQTAATSIEATSTPDAYAAATSAEGYDVRWYFRRQ